MLSSAGDKDVFFDSEDYLPLEESLVAEEVESSKFGYEIWMKEPQSIKKRRESFLQGIGLAEFAISRTCPQDLEAEFEDSSKMDGLERLADCNGAVSSSDYEQQNAEFSEEAIELSFSAKDSESERNQGEAHVESCQNSDVGKKKMKTWWKFFMNKLGRRPNTEFSEDVKSNPAKFRSCRTKVYQHKKNYTEFSALYMRQQIFAHKGLIWTMKFSPDGKYLASGGEDGVVRVWRVTSTNASTEFLTDDNKVGRGKQLRFATVIIPENVFQIDEFPVQEFYGHSSDVLDLAWSNSNYLLSSSKDKTVRLWQVGSDQCLNVFNHKTYVTCIQCNPVDENYFITGSIDGKIRIWGLAEQRVVDWADARDVITAISYRPDGKGLVVGSITGICRFYETSGDSPYLEAQVNIQGRKKASGKRITGIQFCPENSRRLMITSDDSKVHIIEGTDVVGKYKGPSTSGSQMSASFTSTGKHVVSVGEDSRVYMWNYNDHRIPSMKETKSQQSCEYFFSDGISVAIPWSDVVTEPKRFGDDYQHTEAYQEAASWRRDSDRVPVGNWFSADTLCRGSATWPEEELPYGCVSLPETWGLVIVTAGRDGTIKTFHNYGLPFRL